MQEEVVLNFHIPIRLLGYITQS